MRYLEIIAILLMVPFMTSKADVGNGNILSCSSSEVRFKLQDTAAVKLKQGELLFKGKQKPIILDCKPNESDKEEKGADIEYPLYSCVESRSGDGRYLVEIKSGGQIGFLRAEISQEQEAPLEPKSLGLVRCTEDEATDSRPIETSVSPITH